MNPLQLLTLTILLHLVADYNLQGIRLNGLQKGLNIVNGKKVVIK